MPGLKPETRGTPAPFTPGPLHWALPGVSLLAALALAFTARRYHLDPSFVMGAVFFGTTAVCGWILALGNLARAPAFLRHPLVGLSTLLAVGGTLLATVLLAIR